jgi:DNA-binding response OmpR family regulator
LLRDHGYELLTATTGSDGLRLFTSRPVDAIVLEYHLGLLDGGVVANEIKRVQPTIPIVMLADDLELPAGALKSVDALVNKSDGAHFLWASVHFVLSAKATQACERRSRTEAPGRVRRLGRSAEQADDLQAKASPAPMDPPFSAEDFSAEEWRSIRTGIVRF